MATLILHLCVKHLIVIAWSLTNFIPFSLPYLLPSNVFMNKTQVNM